MLTAVVTTSGPNMEVTLVEAGFAEAAFVAAEEEVPENDLNPIAPELKEVVWGFGSFLVLLVLMRYWLFPKVREGMRRRQEQITGDREAAEALTAAARADVAEYEARLASVRVEAQQRVEAARATLESERAEMLAAANGRIAERRAAAAAEVDAARAAAMGDVETAVADVVARAAEIATGRSVDPSAVQAAVRSTMGAEVTS